MFGKKEFFLILIMFELRGVFLNRKILLKWEEWSNHYHFRSSRRRFKSSCRRRFRSSHYRRFRSIRRKSKSCCCHHFKSSCRRHFKYSHRHCDNGSRFSCVKLHKTLHKKNIVHIRQTPYVLRKQSKKVTQTHVVTANIFKIEKCLVAKRYKHQLCVKIFFVKNWDDI